MHLFRGVVWDDTNPQASNDWAPEKNPHQEGTIGISLRAYWIRVKLQRVWNQRNWTHYRMFLERVVYSSQTQLWFQSTTMRRLLAAAILLLFLPAGNTTSYIQQALPYISVFTIGYYILGLQGYYLLIVLNRPLRGFLWSDQTGGIGHMTRCFGS